MVKTILWDAEGTLLDSDAAEKRLSDLSAKKARSPLRLPGFQKDQKGKLPRSALIVA